MKEEFWSGKLELVRQDAVKALVKFCKKHGIPDSHGSGHAISVMNNLDKAVKHFKQYEGKTKGGKNSPYKVEEAKFSDEQKLSVRYRRYLA